MKTIIRKLGDTVIVTMDGHLDFGTYVPLREQLGRLLSPARSSEEDVMGIASHDSPPSPKIIFNLKNLEFVGSSGISSFVQTLKEFNEQLSVKPKYCNVRSEFKRIIKAFDESEAFEFFDSEEGAKQSFDH